MSKSKVQEIVEQSVHSFLDFCDAHSVPYEFNNEIDEDATYLFIHVNKDTVGVLGVPCKNPETVDEWIHYKNLFKEALMSTDLTTNIEKARSKVKSFSVNVNNKHVNRWYDSGQNAQENPIKLAIEEQHDFSSVEIGGSTLVVVDGVIYDCVANMMRMSRLLNAIENDLKITPDLVPAALTFRMA